MKSPKSPGELRVFNKADQCPLKANGNQKRSSSGLRSGSGLPRKHFHEPRVTFLHRRSDGDGGYGTAAAGWRSRVCGWCRIDTLEPGRGAVDPHGQVIVPKAGFKGAGVIVGGHVPETTHHVVDVLAITSCVRSSLVKDEHMEEKEYNKLRY